MNALSWPQSGGIYWSLCSPAGSQIFGTYLEFDNIQRLQLPYPGTYRLAISSGNGGIGPYGFEVSSIQDQTFNYTPSTTVSSNVPFAGGGVLDVPGQVDNYVFTSPSNLLVNVITGAKLSAWRRNCWTLFRYE